MLSTSVLAIDCLFRSVCRCAVRQAEGSGLCSCDFYVCYLFQKEREINVIFFHVKDATVNTVDCEYEWSFSPTNVLLFWHVCVNEWGCVQGSWLYSLRNVQCLKKEKRKKKREKKARFPFTPWLQLPFRNCPAAFDCRLRSSLMPSVFHLHSSVPPTTSGSIVYWTQANVFAIQKEEIQSCDWLRKKHCCGRCSLFSLWAHLLFFFLMMLHFCNITKKTSMLKKVLLEFNSTMSVCIILYALVWC